MKNIDKKYYRKHPRLLEIKLIVIFDILEREMGYERTMSLIEHLCKDFNCNYSNLVAIIGRRFNIKQYSKKDKIRWRQEVIFLGTLEDLTPNKIATDYLGLHSSTLYTNRDIYDIDNFVDKEWLDKLDETVTLCGTETYRNEVKRILEVFDIFSKTMRKL